MSLQALYAQISEQEWVEFPSGWLQGAPCMVVWLQQ